MPTTSLPIDVASVGPHAGVVTLTLTQGDRPVVVLDRDLLESINEALNTIERDHADMRGFVLASDAPRSFVAGANLREIMDLSDDGLDDYLRFGASVFRRLSEMTVTTVAALNQATLGGGLELAMHCDVLIAAQPQPNEPGGPVKEYPIGLPEAGLRICPGWGGTNLLPARIEPERAIRMTASGTPMNVLQAADAGLVGGLVAPDRLLERARELAASEKSRPAGEPRNITEAALRDEARAAFERVRTDLPDHEAAHAVAECVRVGLDEGWEAAIAMERRELIRLRSTSEGKQMIEAFFAKSGG